MREISQKEALAVNGGFMFLEGGMEGKAAGYDIGMQVDADRADKYAKAGFWLGIFVGGDMASKILTSMFQDNIS
ncbi:hypothetical protein [Leminorella grimontii]|uniref:hypothetical protein n=1 Tax=Leminorella grimontii TaxID=82981 RepID=UPI00321F794F